MRRRLALVAIIAMFGGVAYAQTCPAPVIEISSENVCPWRDTTASVQAPAEGEWQNIVWSIDGGAFRFPDYPYEGYTSYGTNVTFYAYGNDPVTLRAHGYHSSGCDVESETGVMIRTVAPPVIEVSQPDLCRYEQATATIQPPAEGTWEGYSWSIEGGSFVTNEYPHRSQYAYTANPVFEADGTGPVTLNVQAYDSFGCQAPLTSIQVPMRDIPLPQIVVQEGSCPQTASITNAQDYVYFHWNVDAARLTTSEFAPTINFHPNGNYLVTLSVQALHRDGCWVENSVQFTPTTVPNMSIHLEPSTLCQGDVVWAYSVNEPGVTYEWSTDGYSGDIFGSPYHDRARVYLRGDTLALTLTGTRTATGCIGSSTMYAMIQSGPVGGFSSIPSSICPNSVATVSTYANAASYAWTVTNGTIVSGQGTASIHVRALDASPVTVRVVKTGPNGCSKSYQQSIPVPPAPAANVTASGPTAFCQGGSVTLTAPSATSYLWSNGATTQSIVANTSGNYSVTITNANGCSSTSAATAVTVHAAPATPAITPSGPTTFCEGGNVTLSAPAGYSYLWSNDATTQSVTVDQSGSYSVTITDGNGCSATSEPAVVTVNPLPVAAIEANGPLAFCEGGSVTLTASNGASHLWSNGATTPSITVAAAGDYSVTVTNEHGCSTTSAATTVTVHDALGIAWINIPQVCNGAEASAQAQAYRNGQYVDDVTYVWSIEGGTITRNEGHRVYFISTSDSVTLAATGTDANGCSATRSQTAFVPPPVTATITPSGPTTFCTGGSVTLTAPEGYGYYIWSNGQEGFSLRSIVVSEPGEYRVTVSDFHNCSATSEPVTVTVNPLPEPVITAAGPTTFCQGGNVTLTASEGASYLWSNGATTQSITVGTSGDYSVTVTNAEGCSATSDATTVTVNALPEPEITASGATTFCQGGNVTLTASAATSYLWSNGATTQSITVSAGGNYSVTVTNAEGCSATSDATTVTVNALPEAQITPSGPTAFCQGGNVTLTASAGAGYLWSNGATTQSITVSASGDYSVTVTNAAGCSATSAHVDVTVHANPAAPVITPSGPTTFCQGGSVTLTAPASAGYLWSNGATTQSITVSASGNYSVAVTNENGCSAASAPAAVSVNAATAITQQPQSRVIPKNTATTLSVTATGTGALTYQWFRGTSGNTSNPISGATASSYTTPKLSRGTYTYWVRVTGSCGSVNSATATITAQ
jgi:PKD-like domain